MAKQMDVCEETGWTVEKLFEELDALAQALESGDDGLEEALKKYEYGMKLCGICAAKLDGVEKQLKVLEEDGSEN